MQIINLNTYKIIALMGNMYKMGRTLNVAKRVKEDFTKQLIFELKLEGRIGVC